MTTISILKRQKTEIPEDRSPGISVCSILGHRTLPIDRTSITSWLEQQQVWHQQLEQQQQRQQLLL